MLKLYNTLNRQVEEFIPLENGKVRLYTCGPTVYDFAHIGNLRTYIFEDLLRRSLEYLDYSVKQAMNITDVGHLVGDSDEGEDKIDKGARREGKHPLEIAKQYEEQFFKDLTSLNILPPQHILRATDSIPEQIEIIKMLEEKGFTYKDEFAVYFDTSKFPNYGALSRQKLDEKKIGAREEVVIDIKKRNPQDFVLWFFTKGKYKNHILRWPSPWGEGFPGWHIECSAISRKLLGQPFDIHAGGVDHIGTHHTNEIAQSEAAFGVPLSNIWMHGEHLVINATRMGKSEGNAYTLQTIIDKGFSPMDYRYFCLQAHYRTQLNFTWDALTAARTALNRLQEKIQSLDVNENSNKENGQIKIFKDKFQAAIEDDLNTPKALAIVWETVHDDTLLSIQKYQLVQKFDAVLGLNLTKTKPKTLPEEIQDLVSQREAARAAGNFALADNLRQQIVSQGFQIKDTESGTKISVK